LKGLRYQLKSVLRDKFCLMTFLLPIVVAAALNFVGQIDFSSLGGFQFGVVEDKGADHMVTWLERYGSVIVYGTQEDMEDGINEPSTNVIGVEADGDEIKTIVSGDELELYRQTAEKLPDLYRHRKRLAQAKPQVLERPEVLAGLQDMFIAVTLIVAMFMGCTFNAVNMISEKEDGVACVNEILPMSPSQYLLQKISVGFICGCLSAALTACICFRLSGKNTLVMLALIVLSGVVAALFGLIIGRAAEGLMVGMVYIKIVMLLFIAVPILSFLVGGSRPLLSDVCYLVPSQAAFEGIMDLSAGNPAKVKDMVILISHCIVWFLLYVGMSGQRRRNA
jgi:ABC-2 type transporter.